MRNEKENHFGWKEIIKSMCFFPMKKLTNWRQWCKPVERKIEETAIENFYYILWET